MSEQPLRPIWTPEDAHQAARDAAQHTPEPAVGPTAARIGPWHLASISPPRGRGCAPGPVGMRPRRATQRAKAMLCVAVIVLILVVGVLWAETFGAL